MRSYHLQKCQVVNQVGGVISGGEYTVICFTMGKDVSTLLDIFYWATVNKTVFLLMLPVVVRKPALNNAMTLEEEKSPTELFFCSYSFKLC